MSACTSDRKRFFANTSKLHWAWCKHTCRHAAALCISYNSSTHARGAHVPSHVVMHACNPTDTHARQHWWVCRPSQRFCACVCANMHREQRKARAGGLFVDHPGYCPGVLQCECLLHYLACRYPVASANFKMRLKVHLLGAVLGDAAAWCDLEKAQTGEAKVCRPAAGTGSPRSGWGLLPAPLHSSHFPSSCLFS